MDELFVDPNQMVRDAIVSALKPYARLASSGWAFYPNPSFDELDAQQRMLVVLLGRKASHMSQKVETDRVSREDLCSLAAVTDGTYRPYAPRLERAGLIRREGDDVWIPEEAVVRASSMVLGRLSLQEENGSRPSKPQHVEAFPSTGSDSNENLGSAGDSNVTESPPATVRSSRKKSVGPRRARAAKDFNILYTGKVDLSAFPHPDSVGDPAKLVMLPLLVARDGYNFEGLPVQQVVAFLHEKYGRDISSEEVEAALNRVRGRYVDFRFDTHLNQAIYCLLEQGRMFLLAERQITESGTSDEVPPLHGG